MRSNCFPEARLTVVGHERQNASVNVTTWQLGPGILELPDGVRIRGRGRRNGDPETPPDWGVVLLGRKPPEQEWPTAWIRWPDFSVPRDWREAGRTLVEAHGRAQDERVEIMCGGGKGRTGTALACLATLGGLSPREAVTYVRANYDRHAVEVPWQRLFIRWFSTNASPTPTT